MKFAHTLYIALATCVLLPQSTKAATGVPAAVTQTANDNGAELLNRVYDNEAYQRNIVSKITFDLHTSHNNVSLPGQLRMRKDEVIRIQLQIPLLGSEVGRLEFTPTEVLIVDRLHKQYVRASYDEVSFLAQNGITFYTLQALFWNKLALPGQKSVGYTDLEKFTVDTAADGETATPITLKDGKMSYEWLASQETGLISQASVTYESGSHGSSTLRWTYDDFQAFGSKKFPYTQTLNISTAATGKQKNIAATFSLGSLSTDDNWEATTTLSSSYTQVSVDEVLSKLISL